MYVGWWASGEYREIAVLTRDLEAIAEIDDERHPGFLVATMARPLLGRRERFAQVVHERRETDGRRGGDLRRIPDDQHDMHAGVDFGVPAGRLRNAVEGVDLGKIFARAPQTAQCLEVHVGTGLSQGALGFLPDPLGYERIDLSRGHHALHENDSVRSYAEAEARHNEPQTGRRAGCVPGSSTNASETWRSRRASRSRCPP